MVLALGIASVIVRGQSGVVKDPKRENAQLLIRVAGEGTERKVRSSRFSSRKLPPQSKQEASVYLRLHDFDRSERRAKAARSRA